VGQRNEELLPFGDGIILLRSWFCQTKFYDT